MALPVGYAQASFVFQCTGISDPIVTTIGCQPQGGISAATIADAVYTSWTSATAPFAPAKVANSYTLTSVDVTLETASGPVLGQKLVNAAGTMVTVVVSAQVCVIARKQTARGGRKGRGRMFLPGAILVEANIDSAGIILPAFRTTLDTNLTAALSLMSSNSVPAFLLHSDPLITPDAIIGMSTVSVCGTQRRRLR